MIEYTSEHLFSKGRQLECMFSANGTSGPSKSLLCSTEKVSEHHRTNMDLTGWLVHTGMTFDPYKWLLEAAPVMTLRLCQILNCNGPKGQSPQNIL